MVTRRRLMLGGAAVAVGALALSRPSRVGGTHDAYFERLQTVLRAAGIDRPVLLIDLDRLDHNIDLVRTSVAVPPARTYRVVVKSLPAPQLVDYVATRAQTRAMMVFHRPFMNAIAALRPQADLLLGKPMPIAAVERFYADHRGTLDPSRQLQWLIDTEARLAQYREFARAKGLKLRVSMEIDVGLHRGGFADPAALAPALATIADNPLQLELAGFMGYDAHVMGLPPLLAEPELPRIKARYAACVELLRAQFPLLAAAPLCFNGAGSPTFRHYEGSGLVNDVSAGTCLMKPSHYDLPILADFQPSAFIATPVLKKVITSGVPTLDWSGPAMRAWNPNTEQTFFTYGGNWMAEPHSPPGLSRSSIYTSSNQEGLYGSRDVQLAVDDFVFLRPLQSEAVLLQFGDLVAIRGEQIVERWPVLPVSI